MRVMTNKGLLRTSLVALLFSFFAIGVQGQSPQASPASSISPEKQALIKELLELTSSKKTIDALFKAQADQMDKDLPEIAWQAASGMKELKSLTPEAREELRLKVIATSARSGRRMYELLQEKIDFSKLVEDIFLPLHDKYFTEAELRDLVAFYKSSTGKKTIEVMPNLLTSAVKQTSDALMPRVMEIVRQIEDEETERMEKEVQENVKTNPTKPAPKTLPKRRRH
jgi:hypothetical protein